MYLCANHLIFSFRLSSAPLTSSARRGLPDRREHADLAFAGAGNEYSAILTDLERDAILRRECTLHGTTTRGLAKNRAVQSYSTGTSLMPIILRGSTGRAWPLASRARTLRP